MIDLNELIERVVANQVAVMASLNVTCDAVPRFFHTQESYPYWVNRIADLNSTQDDGSGNIDETTDFDTYQVSMRLVIGHITESSVAGEIDSVLYDYIPAIKTWFNSRTGLQTVARPNRMRYLMNARIDDSSGLTTFSNSGIGVIQVGTQFTLTCDFIESLTLIGD